MPGSTWHTEPLNQYELPSAAPRAEPRAPGAGWSSLNVRGLFLLLAGTWHFR